MKIHLIAAGQRPPEWVTAGYAGYARRLSGAVQLKLKQIPVDAHRRRTSAQRMLAAIPDGARVIALDIHGKPWSTEELAQQMRDWLTLGSDIALLVGAPDGLAPECLERAAQRWSLGPLTLPHMLVRVIVAEQLYRAWSVLQNHPYHRP